MQNSLIVSDRFPEKVVTGQVMQMDIPCREVPDSSASPFRVVIHGPKDKRMVVGSFLNRTYRRVAAGDERERLEAEGASHWSVRMSAPASGDYQWNLEGQNAAGDYAVVATGRFTASGSDVGPIRIHPDNRRFFAHADGSLYYPVGENICWAGSKGLADYERWIPKLAAVKGNFIRVWMSPFGSFSIENWRPDAAAKDDRGGVGQYLLDEAWRLDRLFELCGRYGIQIMLCLDSFNSLRGTDPHPSWTRNPYNAANGGPCREVADFVNNQAARELYRKRLAYCVRRWGAYSQLMAWEFWNEVDLAEGYTPSAYAPWHVEMARHIRSLDAFGHLITTSFACSHGDPVFPVATLPEMDFVQTHYYGSPENPCEQLDVTLNGLCRFWRLFQDTPYFVGEYGIDYAAQHLGIDRKGVAYETGVWGAVMAGAAGLPMPWYWENVDEFDLYRPMTAAAAFVNDSAFGMADCKPVELIDPCAWCYALGLEWQHEIWLYVRHLDYAWRNVADGKTRVAAQGSLWIPVEPGRRYRMREYDTRTGAVVKEEPLTPTGRMLELRVRDLTGARAFKLIEMT